MEITYCPCKNEKKNMNTFPDNIVLCNKVSNKVYPVSDVHEMGITYLNCNKNDNWCNKNKDYDAYIAKFGTLNYNSKCNQCEDACITNVCHINNNRILVCASNTKYPLWSYCIDKNGCISSDAQFWDIFEGKNLSFVGKLFDGFAVIPKKSFQLIYFKENDCDYKKIKFEDCNTFSDKIIRSILNYEYISGCNKKNNFKFVGFFVKSNQIYYAVQLNGKEREKVRKLYLLKSSFNREKLVLCDDVKVMASYDIYELAKCNNIRKEEALRMRVTGLSYRNNEIFVLASSGSRGYLWHTHLPINAPCKANDSVLKMASNRCNKLCLNKKPRGVTHISNNELFVINDHNNCNKKCENYYYLIKF